MKKNEISPTKKTHTERGFMGYSHGGLLDNIVKRLCETEGHTISREALNFSRKESIKYTLDSGEIKTVAL